MRADWITCDICGCVYRPTTHMGRAISEGVRCPAIGMYERNAYKSESALWKGRMDKHFPRDEMV